MSRKITEFFALKVESSKVERNVISINIDDEISVKLESEESFFTLSKNSQNLSSNNNSGQENQTRIDENVKNEAEKQLLVILQQQKILKCPNPIRTEDNESKTDNLQCQICNKTFKTAKALRGHKKIHDKKFGCKICRKKYPRQCDLNNHFRKFHENPGSYKCEVCKVGFNTKGILKGHQKIHIKNRPKPFKCDKCDFATKHKANLGRHLKSHERIIERCDKCNRVMFKNRPHDCRLDCKYCGQIFKNYLKTAEHIKNFHAEKAKRSFYECDICGLKVNNKKVLMKHMEAKHVNTQYQTFTCDLDGHSFKFKSGIIQHIKSHLPPVKCDFCDKMLTKQYLNFHISHYHPGINSKKESVQKNKIFKCQICFKILSGKSHLTRHIKEHNKTIKCKFCDKMFGTQPRLKAHVRDYHENPDGFKCEICNKKIVTQANLSRHLKTHDLNRLKDYKCTQCDFATDEKRSLETHLNFHKRKDARIAAIKTPHNCPQCPTVERSEKSLNSHMRTVHPKVLLECDICGKMIKVKSSMLVHFRGFHKIKP